MLIIPAIDLIKGKCVRLEKGDYTKVTTYNVSPLEIAKNFQKEGYKLIHVVDLEGAKQGRLANFKTISTLAEKFPLQVGGGIRTEKDADKLFTAGVKRIILGTIAFKNPLLLKKILQKYGPEKICVSVDVKKNLVMLKGWREKSNLTLREAIRNLRKVGLKYLIFTDIEKDGMLSGINLTNVKKVIGKGFKIIIAGGVTTEKDLDALKKLKIYGCIMGKALYQKNDLAKRIIPCMDIKNGRVVKGTNFINLRDAGDPVALGKYYSDMGADELMFLDIMATVEKRKTLYALVKKIAANINIPFAVGGGVKTISDIQNLLKSGADKVSIGSAAVEDEKFIKKAAARFGTQCIVVSIDAKKVGGKWLVFIKGGRKNTKLDAIKFAKKMGKLGAGELLINSLDRDGTKQGYDLELLKRVGDQVNIPIIASSGAGRMQDFADAFKKSNVSAALAASLFHYRKVKIPTLKKYLARNNLTIRI